MRIETKSQPVVIVGEAFGSVVVRDPDTGLLLFKRRVPERKKITIQLPVTFEEVEIDSVSFDLKKVKPLRVYVENEFVASAISVAKNIKTLEPGRYSIGGFNFICKTLENTPARVNRKDGTVELDKRQLQHLSLPIIVFILLHEYAHYYWHTNSEVVADLQAVSWFLKAGFPSIEAVYALTKVLSDNNLSRIRATLLYDYIQNFNNKTMTYGRLPELV
ncbi:MAG: hypothetical protein KatS3mg101_1161 [Patescibacteria group bacterium]|nr:MAG: hypothetical protein KatS3mg101_1161 [Patescibacteria group bacterium]